MTNTSRVKRCPTPQTNSSQKNAETPREVPKRAMRYVRVCSRLIFISGYSHLMTRLVCKITVRRSGECDKRRSTSAFET